MYILIDFIRNKISEVYSSMSEIHKKTRMRWNSTNIIIAEVLGELIVPDLLNSKCSYSLCRYTCEIVHSCICDSSNMVKKTVAKERSGKLVTKQPGIGNNG